MVCLSRGGFRSASPSRGSRAFAADCAPRCPSVTALWRAARPASDRDEAVPEPFLRDCWRKQLESSFLRWLNGRGSGLHPVIHRTFHSSTVLTDTGFTTSTTLAGRSHEGAAQSLQFTVRGLRARRGGGEILADNS